VRKLIQCRQSIRRIVFSGWRISRTNDFIDVKRVETGDFKIEIEFWDRKGLKLDLKDLRIPGAKLAKPVVGQRIRPLLYIGKMRDPNGRNLREPELYCCKKPPVTREYGSVFVD
jgi:hypothetical protein